MKKDIDIPKVNDVYVAAVNEFVTKNESDWNLYLINNQHEDLNIVIILSMGFSDTKETSKLRKRIDVLPGKSYVKFEMLYEDLFQMTNQFKVSFFQNNMLFDKTFTLKPNSISIENLKDIPLLQHKGVLAD